MQSDQKLLILHAGSLSLPFKQLTTAFSNKNPSIIIQTEAAGSRICARKITELGVPADIMASADSDVIRSLMMPRFADYCIDFSTNEIVIMYEEKSRDSDRITSENWHEILLSSGNVEYGHSDPNADPCGYRTHLSWKLAEKYYQSPGLYDRLRKGVPLRNIRSKETDLLALLETGELDYIFIYRSVAEQHEGLYLTLPDEINLKSIELKDYYSTVSVDLTGKKPDKTIRRKGAPIVYGITIPKTSRSPQLAAQFLAFVLSSEGQKILQENGHPEFIPTTSDHVESIPSIASSLVRFRQK